MNGSVLKLLTFVILLDGLSAWRSFVIELTQFQYELNHDYVRECDLKLTQDKGLNVINGSVTFRKDIRNLMINFEVIIPRPDNDWTLINVTMDGCKLLEGSAKSSINLPNIVLEELRKSKNFFPKKCPLEKDKVIYIENMYMDPEKFPPYMFALSFKTLVVLRESDEVVIKMLTSGFIQSKSAMRNIKRQNVTKDAAES